MLLNKQYLIVCYLPFHPSHHIVMDDPTPRRIRHDYRTFHTVIIHIISTIVDLQSVREVQHSLHQTTGTTAMDELSHNRVINQHPPAISDNERQLPRVTRIILAQLRSGWSNNQNSFRERIILGLGSLPLMQPNTT